MSFPKTTLTYAGLADMMGNNIPELGAGNEAITMRKATNGLFVLNSADRNYTGAATSNDADTQPWNSFRITKPQPLLDGYVKNMGATEVRFPWAIPNITSRNCSIYIKYGSDLVLRKALVAVGFWTPSELATQLHNAFVAAGTPGGVTAPTVTYNDDDRSYVIAPADNNSGFFLYTDPIAYDTSGNIININNAEYIRKPSLARTLGLSVKQLGVFFTLLNPDSLDVKTQTTFVTYTDYVDIISNRLCYDSDVKDGDSSVKTISDLICRIYLADEISNYAIDPPGTRPFMIHRQYVTPKYLKLNPTQFFNSIDIQVRDMYGDLVVLPPYYAKLGITYPDFQITFVSSSD